ncbi:hypothetical protein EVC45_23020 [Paraburkholderia sp. UYCP14C]|uniref:hypothetical protein n=1 Tax=Paraburkholderia sp. UYCP14C TaxID=2511130 RepID=UPI0010229554|nr:hypothetical protein [Paraburkholderia sp. UYCP14C]RZF27454.1 hypothetical protein EVC45_23020 [Paraburkholderia sp. UYCP14C]
MASALLAGEYYDEHSAPYAAQSVTMLVFASACVALDHMSSVSAALSNCFGLPGSYGAGEALRILNNYRRLLIGEKALTVISTPSGLFQEREGE